MGPDITDKREEENDAQAHSGPWQMKRKKG